MPLSLLYTQGVMLEIDAVKAGKRITDAFLKWHNMTGNKVMTPNITMQIQALPKGGSLSGGELFEGAWLECKTPSFALVDRGIQEGFFGEVTDIIEEYTGGKIPRDRIFTNAVHTVDGTWNLDGKALTNDQIGAAVSAG